MDRKQLLLESEIVEKKVDKIKLNSSIDEGMALASMKESRGWRLLFDKFIKMRLSEDRFYTASLDTLADTRAAMNELRELMRFIDSRIDAAKDAANKIKE